MIYILGILITVLSVAGLGLIVEGATGAITYTLARLRAQAPPHAKAGGNDDDHDEES